MSTTTKTLLLLIGFLMATLSAQAAAPDAAMPRMVGGGLRQLVVAQDRADPRLHPS